MCFFVQTNHTRKELLFLMFKEINLRNHSSLHKLFYSLDCSVCSTINNILFKEQNMKACNILAEVLGNDKYQE